MPTAGGGSSWIQAFESDGWAAQIVDYAIVALDPSGVVQSWNAGAARVKGYVRGEVVGQHFSVFYTREDRLAGLPMRLLEQARRESRVESTGWRVRKDGSRFWADVVITAVYRADGSLQGFVKVTRDLTDQHRLETELRESEQRFRMLVEQVRDYAIIGLDPNGVVTSWNLGAEVVKGYSAAEAVGRHFSMFYTEADRESGLAQRLLARARTDGRVDDEGWRVRKDGTLFWASVVITAVHDPEGRLTGYVKVTRDHTEQHEVERARDFFLAGISHDFRTPLMAVEGFASVIRELSHDDTITSYATRIGANSRRLMTLVEQLLEYSRLRSGRVNLRSAPVPLGPLLESVVGDMSGVLAEHRVSFTLRDAVASADESALARVFTNLLTNAAKYSEPGTTIDVRSAREGSHAVVTIADRGRGIDAADLATIFDEFERGQRAESDGGFGLGLSVVRQLLTQQGGTVVLRPRVDGGTEATVRLPLAQEAVGPAVDDRAALG